MEWSNEVIMEFLDMYEREPAIWNPRSPDHKERYKVYDAWKRIQNNLSVTCSLNELKRKKETLMATYRKLAGKVKSSTKTGTGTKEVYKPEWFAYEKMASFLHSIYTPRKSKTCDEEGPGDEYDGSLDNTQATRKPMDSSEICHDTASLEAAECDTSGPPAKKPKKAEHRDKQVDETFSFSKQVANKPKATKDESSLFCELLCVKLRALEEGYRQIAMHQINNVMFNLIKPNIRQLNWSSPHYSYDEPERCPDISVHSPGRGMGNNDSSADNSSHASFESAHCPPTSHHDSNKPICLNEPLVLLNTSPTSYEPP